MCIDFDATLITAHSDDKDGAAPTYKRGFGFHPLGCWLDRGDGTGEALAARLRPGNAGSNTAADHIDVFETAIAQLDGLIPSSVRLVARADRAGSSQAFLAYLREAKVGFSAGYAIDALVRQAIRAVADDAWVAGDSPRRRPTRRRAHHRDHRPAGPQGVPERRPGGRLECSAVDAAIP